MKKRTLAGLLSMVMVMSVLAGCGSKGEAADANQAVENMSTETANAQANTEAEVTEAEQDVVADAQSEEFVLEYPAHMQAEGYTEPVVLDAYPETIVTLSTYPVLTLLEMDVKMAAVPSTKVIEYPENYDAVILPGMMSEQFDMEQVVALEPDLVFVPSSVREMYEPMFEAAEVPVYYVAMNSTTVDVYTLIKEQTQAIVDAFSVDEASAEKGAAVMAQFETVEARFDEIAALMDGKSAFALTVAGESSFYLNTESSTLGCMLSLCGLENVCESDDSASMGHSMGELDMETAISYDPDVMFITGSGTLEENMALMEASYELNPEYWDAIEAYKNGDVFYLPSSYVSTAGINIITNLNNLMDMMEEKYGA